MILVKIIMLRIYMHIELMLVILGDRAAGGTGGGSSWSVCIGELRLHKFKAVAGCMRRRKAMILLFA